MSVFFDRKGYQGFFSTKLMPLPPLGTGYTFHPHIALSAYNSSKHCIVFRVTAVTASLVPGTHCRATSSSKFSLRCSSYSCLVTESTPAAFFPFISLWHWVNISLFMRCARDVNFSFGFAFATSAILLSFVSIQYSTSVFSVCSP